MPLKECSILSDTQEVRLGAVGVQMSRPSKFPALATIKLDAPVPPSALQVENTPPASAVISRLGDLQRIVLLQLALSGAAKPDTESSPAEKKGGDRPMSSALVLVADLCQAVRAAIFQACYIDMPCPRLVGADLGTSCRISMQLQSLQGPCMCGW